MSGRRGAGVLAAAALLAKLAAQADPEGRVARISRYFRVCYRSGIYDFLRKSGGVARERAKALGRPPAGLKDGP